MEQRIYKHFLEVKSVTTDTRNILAGAIFFALKGERFNGNEFAIQALNEGASMVVVDEKLQSDDNRIIVVKNVLEALQKVAYLYRQSLNIPFLAITGSNGKTTTKELIRAVLAKKFRVSATKGNLNNHIGIPLTILSIPANCEFAIIEMGANHQGEIKSYCQYAQPNYAMITNMGKAHLEGFGGEEGVVKGKKELYDYVSQNGIGIFVNTEIEKLKLATEGMSIIPYGQHSGDFRLTSLSESPTVKYVYESKAIQISVNTNLAGAYNLFNIASAIAVGKYFGINENDINAAIEEYVPDNNRSQIQNTGKNVLIMDAYNANPTSLEYALIALSKQEHRQKFFVIGDMLELGSSANEEHLHILELAKSLGLNGIVVGHVFSKVSSTFTFQAFHTNEDAKEYLRSLNLKEHIILIKGSRGIKLEEVVSVL